MGTEQNTLDADTVTYLIKVFRQRYQITQRIIKQNYQLLRYRKGQARRPYEKRVVRYGKVADRQLKMIRQLETLF